LIEHRLAVYRAETRPLIDYYRGRGILLTVHGDQPTDDVYAAIKIALLRRPAAPPPYERPGRSV
jgi:adenylate kinase